MCSPAPAPAGLCLLCPDRVDPWALLGVRRKVTLRLGVSEASCRLVDTRVRRAGFVDSSVPSTVPVGALAKMKPYRSTSPLSMSFQSSRPPASSLSSRSGIIPASEGEVVMLGCRELPMSSLISVAEVWREIEEMLTLCASVPKFACHRAPIRAARLLAVSLSG